MTNRSAPAQSQFLTSAQVERFKGLIRSEALVQEAQGSKKLAAGLRELADDHALACRFADLLSSFNTSAQAVEAVEGAAA